jgi:hypothetical protein
MGRPPRPGRDAAGGLRLPRAEYYLPSRSTGTLLCYFRHHAHGDPFLWPGLNDITAFVDFTAIAEAGFEAGLDVLGYTDQANLLFNCGVLECLARRAPEESTDYIRAAKAVQRLTGPHEMGELFKVIALGRGISQPLIGFLRGDRLHASKNEHDGRRRARAIPLPRPVIPGSDTPRSGRHPRPWAQMPLGRRRGISCRPRASSGGTRLAFRTSSS